MDKEAKDGCVSYGAFKAPCGKKEKEKKRNWTESTGCDVVKALDLQESFPVSLDYICGLGKSFIPP